MDRLLLAGFLGFASGILCRSLFSFSWTLAAGLLLLSVLMLGASLIQNRMLLRAIALFLLMVSLGSIRVMLVPSTLPASFGPLLETSVSLEGTIVGEPDIRESMQRTPIKVTVGEDTTKVLAVLPLYPVLEYGDRVQVTGKLVLPEPFETDSGRTFRYDRFLEKDGIFALIEFGHAERLSSAERIGHRTMRALLRLKYAFQNALALAIPEPGSSLASGLLTGGKQGLGSELLDAFIVSGLVHIVVLSGYNVMIVSEAVLRLFGFLPKRAAATIAGITIALFVLVAGAGSASIRAGIMAALMLVARATGRTYAVVRALLFVAALMLLFNPLLLVHDPGFQLSFLATLGLILLHPLIECRIGFVRPAMIRDILASTLAAQIAVLPLLLYQTGLLSLVAVPANLLVLPLVPLAMLLAAMAGVLSLLMPMFAPLFGFPAYLVLSYTIGIARLSADFPLASVGVPTFPFPFVVLAYTVLGYVIANAPKPVASGRKT